MKIHRPVRILSLMGVLVINVHAIDIDPSKKNVPDMGGSTTRFDIFAGDPARIQRANAIDFADIKSSLEIAEPELSLYTMKEEGLRPNIRLTFKIKNTSPKRTYTLSFPNAQRYDFIVRDQSNLIIYKWSADKKFVETVGTTMINPGDILGYTDQLPVSDFYEPLAEGTYTIEASLANYPEVISKASLKVFTGQPTATSAGTLPTSTPPTAKEASEKPEEKGQPSVELLPKN